MTQGRLVLGTRGSSLALRQAGLVRDDLLEHGCEVELREITTTGDRILDVPLSDIGDKGLFTKELDLALLEGSIHLAVHSLKDLPTRLPPGLVIAAVTRREDPRDAFVARAGFSGGLADVPDGAVIGTASLRRRAQLKVWRSDLRVEPVRGNVDTRIRKLDAGDWTGVVLAAAGLYRLGLQERVTTVIDTELMIPAVGQGALAVVCAETDESTCSVLRAAVHDASTYKAVIAERAFLRRLEGGCSIPAGAHAQLTGTRLVMDGCVADPDGTRIYRGRREGSPAEADDLGTGLADALIAEGAGEILDELRAGSA